MVIRSSAQPYSKKDHLAKSGVQINTTNIQGETWAELDTPEDYEICRELFGNSDMARKRFAVV